MTERSEAETVYAAMRGDDRGGGREMVEAVRDQWAVALAVIVLVAAAVVWWRARR